MYNSGYIPFYRDELDDWLAQDPQRFMWWIWIRCRAAYKPCMLCVGQARVEVYLQYGELAVTKTYLKNVWGVNIKTVDRFLKQMVKDGRIACRDDKGVLIIQVLRNELISAPAGKANDTTAEKDTMTPCQTDSETATKTDMVLPDEIPKEIPDEVTAQMTPIIRNIKDKNSKNKDIDLSARERSFFDELKKSDLTLGQMTYSLKPANGLQELLLLLDEFINQCLGTDDFHSTFSEFKRHFMNWARKEIRSRNTENKKFTQNGKKEKDPGPESGASRRRGAEVSARTAADYEKPFSAQPEAGNY